MSDTTNEDSTEDNSVDGCMDIEPTAVTSNYKILGQLTADNGVGVLGQNDAESGTPIGIMGAVPNASDVGFGFSTPHDARIEGILDTSETDYVVEAGTKSTGDAQNIVQGHSSNQVTDDAVGATISGGGLDDGSTVEPNQAHDNYATVGGGEGNVAGDSSDKDPTASTHATVGGGLENTASELFATVVGGDRNTASGTNATVVGGSGNTASGLFSFAAGRCAETETSGGTAHDGAFVWGDSSIRTVRSGAADQFVVQAEDGLYIDGSTSDLPGPGGSIDGNGNLNETSTGAVLTNGEMWSDSSSRTVKEDGDPVDGSSVLERVESLHISEWSYEDEPDDIRHLGPMAEDFYGTFGLGTDDEHIAPLDTSGVALAAIQGLSEKLDEKEERIEQQAVRIEDLEAENEQLRKRLATIEDHLGGQSANNEALLADD